MKTIKVDTTEYARQWIATFSRITISIQPLSTQIKVAEILDDKFTEFQIELKLRKKQY